MRGTLLNTATVAGGALLGLLVGKWIPSSYQDLVITAAALVTTGVGIQMFLKHKNTLIIAMALMLGVLVGHALGIEAALGSFAAFAKEQVGGSGRFVEGLVTTSLLYCVGPMTLMGCIQDGTEGKSDLLRLKAVLDGISSVFFAAAFGEGVLVSAFVVLVVQGALTLAARPLGKVAEDEDMMAEAVGAGGAMLLGTAIRMLQLKAIPVGDFTPALFLAPGFVAISRRFARK